MNRALRKSCPVTCKSLNGTLKKITATTVFCCCKFVKLGVTLKFMFIYDTPDNVFLFQFLTEFNYPHQISMRILSAPSMKEFCNIFQVMHNHMFIERPLHLAVHKNTQEVFVSC